MNPKLAFLSSLVLPLSLMAAEPAKITVNADQPGHKIPSTLWGIFFEDISLAADGGINPELVRNRNFEDSDKPDQWAIFGSDPRFADMSIDREKPVSPKNPRSLKVVVSVQANERAGVANDGYFGMNVVKGENYKLSFDARSDGSFTGPLTVSLESASGQIYAQQQFNALTPDWKKFTATLTASDSDPKARLVISTDQSGTFWLDMVSLLPEKTWKGHGLRNDLLERLAALKPAFLRFPGGGWVQGLTLKESYRWKDAIGDPSERRTQFNVWKYQASNGIGLHEYLVMCEDLGCEPLFVINAGMAWKKDEHQPLDKMGEYVQDALDAIEYANGPVDSKWGALRAKAGHPAPFHLKYLQIGNEDGGKAYIERWPLFAKAIKEKYPDITLIACIQVSNCPPELKPEIVDEHFYTDPEMFIRRADRYDSYDRKGPKIFVGEYGSNVSMRGAVGEAAFMTGLERNSDLVVMSCYAPLFCNLNHKSWHTNLINFDTSRLYVIPSYYVQEMFAKNTGQVVLPTTVAAPVLKNAPIKGPVGVGTWKTQAEFKEIKVTRNGETLAGPDLNDTKGWRMVGKGDWKAQGGILTQSSDGEDVRAVFGDKSWTDYTLSLKARKLSGSNGFIIHFGLPNDNAQSSWVVGGWGNSAFGLQMPLLKSDLVPGKLENNRWYDIRIEVKGDTVKCYLDDKLIHSTSIPSIPSLYASTSRDDKTGEILLKVVNADTEARETEIHLTGVTGISGNAKGIVLASADAKDTNTLQEPAKVAPKEMTIPNAAPKFQHTFPANSVTVLRLQTR